MNTPLPIFHCLHTSPVGPLRLAASDAGVQAIEFPTERYPRPRDPRWRPGTHPLLDAVAAQLDEYFTGQRTEFDLPLALEGTEFQRVVWHTLRSIPYGKTISYAELAARIGKPNAVRAVGAANGRNPIPIMLPCHRVIGADGSLTGFGGGLATKRFLLELEGAMPKLGTTGELFVT